MVKELCAKDRKMIEEVSRYPEAKQALSRTTKTPNSLRAYALGIKAFSDFMGKTPTEIVAEYRQDIKANQYEGFEKWEETFKQFDEHLGKTHKGSGMMPYHSGALALINQNVPRSLKLRAESPEVYQREIPPISQEDLKMIYGNVATPLQKALISFFKDSGMSKADVVRLKIKDLEDFDKGNQWIRLNVTREKEHVKYETFIGPNAVNDLRIYFNLRRRLGENLTADSPLFASLNKKHTPYHEGHVSATLKHLTEKVGKDISSHRLRKYFETYMALVVRHPIVLKYWMGHKVKGKGGDIEAKYIIPPTPEQLKLYQDAYKNIDLTGGTLEDRLKTVEELTKSLSPDQRAMMDKLGMTLRQKGKKGKTSTDGGQCEDGEHCEDFREIEEGELLAHLRQGFHIVHNLQNGKVIVER